MRTAHSTRIQASSQTQTEEAIISSYCLFDTSIGSCGLVWKERALVGLQLPEATRQATKQRVKALHPASKEIRLADAPPWVQKITNLIQRHLVTGVEDFAKLPLDLTGVPDFHRRVYEAARAVQAGSTATYQDMAVSAGSPGASRAVGQALGRNPLALIVPCHRILAAGGKPGGFSAQGGLKTKARLLAIEAAGAWPKHGDFATTAARAVAHLTAADPVLGEHMRRVGPCVLQPKQGASLFATLAESIVYQQLSGKAAATIFGRFRGLFPGAKFPQPAAVLAVSDAALRGVGLSGAKTKAIQDLALKVKDGTLPTMNQLRKMTDTEIIDALTVVRGVGQWTVEMLLVFDLGRLNVLPVDDYGIKKGFAKLYGKRTLPSAAALHRFGERWQPYRSIAAWYLWRALDLAAGTP